MNRLFASVLILFLTALSVAAQEFTVSGTVYDDRDRPMEFVSVVQKDLFISTYTDHDGNFSIRTPIMTAISRYGCPRAETLSAYRSWASGR